MLVLQIQYCAAWDTISARHVLGRIFGAEAVDVSCGRAICFVEGPHVFLPGSHLTGKIATEKLIGMFLPLIFFEVNQEDNKLVNSKC